MQPTPAKKGINLNLEALRGFAALFVVFNHIEALHTAFNKDYLPTATIVLAPNGRLFVLVFFVLSGYVIGLNHTKPMHGAETKSYIKKRFLRIYPIYVVALLLTLFVAQHSYPAKDITFNFLMLHILLVPPFLENGPAWSLHYEMVYYGLFIFISRFRLNVSLLIALSVVAALGSAGILSSYFMGLSFWLTGLLIAQKLKQDKPVIKYNRLAAALLLLLALDQLLSRPGIPAAIGHLMYQLPGGGYFTHLQRSSPLIHHPTDLFYLPVYAFIVLVFTGKKWRYERVCFVALNILLVAAIMATALQYLNGYTSHIKVYLLSLCYYITALLFWFINWNALDAFGRKLMAFGAWFGGISYALYIVHAPIVYFVGRFTFSQANQVVNYILKLIVFAFITTVFSWLLEKRMQPYLNKIWRHRTPSKESSAHGY